MDVDAWIEGLHELVLFGDGDGQGAAFFQPVVDDAAAVQGGELELLLEGGQHLGVQGFAFEFLGGRVLGQEREEIVLGSELADGLVAQRDEGGLVFQGCDLLEERAEERQTLLEAGLRELGRLGLRLQLEDQGGLPDIERADVDRELLAGGLKGRREMAEVEDGLELLDILGRLQKEIGRAVVEDANGAVNGARGTDTGAVDVLDHQIVLAHRRIDLLCPLLDNIGVVEGGNGQQTLDEHLGDRHAVGR